MNQEKVLFVLTGHDRLGPADDESAPRTGFHLAEAAIPWRILTEAGIQVDIATPTGKEAPVDPGSRDLEDATNRAFLADDRISAQLRNPKQLKMLDLGAYRGIYFPGGHGTMWDLPDDAHVQHAVRVMFEADQIVAAVCHGPAALVDVRLSDNSWLVDGREISVFTDAEERAVEKDDIVPFLLAERLESRGAKLNSAENFEAAVSVDGNLITGQNPASAEGVGKAIRKAIEKQLEHAA